MRLINTKTLELESFNPGIQPRSRRYAILSHRWGAEEVTFHEFGDLTPAVRMKQGFTKILKACETALSVYKLKYLWVDTCCIDKSSSTELSEAINRMFSWYSRSEMCIAYLADVECEHEDSLPSSDWFRRGWTLQELLAPSQVHFFDRNWKQLGNRSTLSVIISEITGIPSELLDRGGRPPDLARYSVGSKMCWASWRETTRVEDLSYCLLGLFDVNMPLLYGEGELAFHRLQEAIIRKTTDMSVLYHEGIVSDLKPRDYMGSEDIEFRPEDELYASEDFGLSVQPRGMLELRALACPAQLLCSYHDSESLERVQGRLVLLNCSFRNDYLSRPAIFYQNAIDDPATNRVEHLRYYPSMQPRVTVSAGENPGIRVLKHLHVRGKDELHYDLGDCKVETLYLREHFSPWRPELERLPPQLQINSHDEAKYRTKEQMRFRPYFDDYRKARNPSQDGQTVFLRCTAVRITDDASDEFYIVWRLVPDHDAEPDDKRPPWWEDAPRCAIIEGPVSEPSLSSDAGAYHVNLPTWNKHVLSTPITNCCSPLPDDRNTSVLTCRRPTGIEIVLTTSRVDFLGRRGFELTIEEKTAVVGSESRPTMDANLSPEVCPSCDTEQPTEAIDLPDLPHAFQQGTIFQRPDGSRGGTC
ncbi:heterokaryon incompatibility protein-domain-containing protein [Coniochaeta sp. 2T2.1]|nr:heterokaryon incompatibility protein-domain-containing protein [Coniochaeta sp. 2T2.1]